MSGSTPSATPPSATPPSATPPSATPPSATPPAATTPAAITTAGGPSPVSGARGAGTVVAGVVVGVVGLGVVLGVLWWWLAPMARAQVEGGQILLAGHQELQVGQDGWFAMVTAVCGILAAALVGVRPEGRAALLGPLLAALVSLVAWRTGVLLGPGSLQGQVAAGVTDPLTPLQLHAYGVLLVGPFLFAVTQFLAALFSGPGRH